MLEIAIGAGAGFAIYWLMRGGARVVAWALEVWAARMIR